MLLNSSEPSSGGAGVGNAMAPSQRPPKQPRSGGGGSGGGGGGNGNANAARGGVASASTAIASAAGGIPQGVPRKRKSATRAPPSTPRQRQRPPPPPPALTRADLLFGRVIGRGNQGCVRLAMCKATKKRYVVKQLNINHRSVGNGNYGGASSGVNDDELERVGGAPGPGPRTVCSWSTVTPLRPIHGS